MNDNKIYKLITDFIKHFNLKNFYLLVVIFDKETSSWKDYNNDNEQLYQLDAIVMDNKQKRRIKMQLNKVFMPILDVYKTPRNDKKTDYETNDEKIKRLEIELAKKDEIIIELRNELAKKDKIIDDLQIEIKELKIELAKKDQIIIELRNDLSKALERAEIAEKRAEVAEKRAADLQSQLDELKMMFLNLQNEFAQHMKEYH